MGSGPRHNFVFAGSHLKQTRDANVGGANAHVSFFCKTLPVFLSLQFRDEIVPEVILTSSNFEAAALE